MQPLEIIDAAVREASCDADRMLCWFINSAPPAKRRLLYERLSTAIDTAKLTGLLTSPLPLPSLFTGDEAERIWEELIGHLQLVLTEKKYSEAVKLLSPFFCPDGLQFAPQAYPGRWAPVTWNVPLTPSQVRDTLGIKDTYLLELVDIARALVAAEREREHSRPQNLLALSQHKFAGLCGKPLRVAVLPYADALPMVTMLYAVSDMVEDIGFGPASFYKKQSPDPLCVSIEEGVFNAGYATSYQLDKLKKSNPHLVARRVFDSVFMRSLFLRGQFKGVRKIPQLDHLSFVGQLGPNRACTLEDSLSDSIFKQYTFMNFQETFPISEYLDPVVNWEIPLVLAFAGGLNGYDKSSWDGLALTVSTDAHLWAASFALNLQVDAAATTTEPICRRGAWDPSKESSADQEDKQSELLWFVPDTDHSVRLMERLKIIVRYYIDQKVSDGLESLRERDAPQQPISLCRQKLLPIARSLLAPLMSTFPTYRGSMLAAPPEAWMTKLQGPAAYVSYRPFWHEKLKPASGDAHAVEHHPLMEYMKSVA